MSQSPSSIREDYEAIEAAVMETPRGRWFLSEYLRRNQARETRDLLAAMRKLERAVMPAQRSPLPLRPVLEHAASALAAIDAENPASLPEAVARMAMQTARQAARMEKLSATTPQLEDMAKEQHNLARKLEILASALGEIAALDGEGHDELAQDEPPLQDDNLDWFAEDAELFAEPPAPAPAPDPVRDPQEPAESAQLKEGEILPPAGDGAPETDIPSSPVQGQQPASGEPADEGFMSIIIKPAPQPEGQGGDETAAKSSRPRIIITRKSSSSELEIPFLDKDKTPQEA